MITIFETCVSGPKLSSGLRYNLLTWWELVCKTLGFSLSTSKRVLGLDQQTTFPYVEKKAAKNVWSPKLSKLTMFPSMLSLLFLMHIWIFLELILQVGAPNMHDPLSWMVFSKYKMPHAWPPPPKTKRKRKTRVTTTIGTNHRSNNSFILSIQIWTSRVKLP